VHFLTPIHHSEQTMFFRLAQYAILGFDDVCVRCIEYMPNSEAGELNQRKWNHRVIIILLNHFYYNVKSNYYYSGL